MIRNSLVMTFLLMISLVSHAKVSDARPCLTHHIRDAMALNETRLPLYSFLSDGRSEEISRRLLKMEEKLSLQTPMADSFAVPFQLAGVRILCDDLIDMSKAPSFQASNEAGSDSLENFRAPAIEEIHAQLKELYKAKDLSGIFLYTNQVIEKQLNQPRYNCLVRHMLESIRRMAALAPIHNEKAQQKLGISSLFLSRAAIKTHLRLLEESAELDKLAAPLQAEGLQILCQDVPVIPVP